MIGKCCPNSGRYPYSDPRGSARCAFRRAVNPNAALHIVRFDFNLFHDNTSFLYDGNKAISAVRLNMRIRAGAFRQVR